MGFLTAALTAASVATSVASGIGQRRAANFATKQGARMATDAKARGEEEVARYQRELAQLMGRQRTTLAAQGLALDEGSAAQVTADTKRIGETDVATIRENARREAFGIRSQSEMNARTLRAGATASFIQGGSTLLTSAIDPWQRWQGNRALRATASTRSAIGGMAGRVDTGAVGRASGWDR